MNKNEAIKLLKPHLQDYADEVLTPSGRGMYCCPFCGSGTHRGKNSDGALSIDAKHGGERWKCFSCQESGDIVDLCQKLNNVTQGEAFTYLYQKYGLIVDDSPEASFFKGVSEKKEAKEEDYTGYYTECADRLVETNYLVNRGIMDATAKKYGVGYDPYYNKGTGPKSWKAIIIPTGKGSYVVRNTDTSAGHGDRYRKTGPARLFNAHALRERGRPVWIVEGELDALSIAEARNGRAVGLGSISNISLLLNAIKAHKPESDLIIALDNDERGQTAGAQLYEDLKKIDGVNASLFKGWGDYNDPNDFLVKDRERFVKCIIEAEEKAAGLVNEKGQTLEEELEEYNKQNALSYIEGMIEEIQKSADFPALSTGFPFLNYELDGGFFEGLYIVGAISSLGKTTFVLQIADYIASTGNDVMIFSLEMSRHELMAKSISRNTLLEATRIESDLRNAKTERGITNGSKYKNYSDTEMQLIKAAYERYSQYAGHIWIIEGVGDVSVEVIKEQVERHAHLRGRAPVVVVDYLQILAPHDPRASDKQNTDKAVLELKRLSRDLKNTVIAVSSFNRENYKQEASMQAFKESGSIEYGADVLLGLQLKRPEPIIDEKTGKPKKVEFDVDEEKKKDPREVELKILKNRHGRTGERINYKYYPKFNYFEELRGELEWDSRIN